MSWPSTPRPMTRPQDLDYYGNTATYFQVTSPHRVLDILATSRVEVDAPTYDEAALSDAVGVGPADAV